ncbi:MAG: DUF4912 domain-containing protein [Verrucomicrobiae bacterium]|nr:DUF4912 domain-containing protein [Verrucomicrobiae bacterium]
MNKSKLESLRKEELLARARKLGLRLPDNVRKAELVERISKAESAPAAGERRVKLMDHSEGAKKEKESPIKRVLKRVTGKVEKVAATPPQAVPPSYARKPASNIGRKTTFKRLEKVISASKEKRAKKITEEHMERAEPVMIAAPANPDQDLVAHKFDAPAHPQPAAVSQFENLGELPEAYGTGRVFLTARDPHWLYAYWDLSWRQLQDFRERSSDRTVRLRIYKEGATGSELKQDLVLTPEARNWFIHVGEPRTRYRAELGYYQGGQFHRVGGSGVAKTPADDFSPNLEARFATLPYHITFRELLEILRSHFLEGEELLDVLHRLQAKGFRLPFDYEGIGEGGNDFDQLYDRDVLRRIRMGSFELSEWVRERLKKEALGGFSSWSSPSSPFGASWQRGRERGFWFNVNAEVIIYGETDPRARVFLEGQPIQLRPDGTFRFHFALPDGEFRLPMAAESPDQLEVREVAIDFTRSTDRNQLVGDAPRRRDLPDPLAAKR